MRGLWINAAVGVLSIVQNVPSAMLYASLLCRGTRIFSLEKGKLTEAGPAAKPVLAPV